MTFYRRRQRKARAGQSRQGTMLCDYRDDKSHYSSFLQRRDPYATYMSHTEASTPHDPDHVASTDHVTSNTNHVTTFQFPCDVQVLDSDTPDVIYSPRIPRDAGLTTCQACRNTQIYNTPCPTYEQSQRGKLLEKPSKPILSCVHTVNRGGSSAQATQPLRSFGVVSSKENEKKLFHTDKSGRSGSMDNIVSV